MNILFDRGALAPRFLTREQIRHAPVHDGPRLPQYFPASADVLRRITTGLAIGGYNLHVAHGCATVCRENVKNKRKLVSIDLIKMRRNSFEFVLLASTVLIPNGS
jgi:hypothetical protein